MKRKGNPVAAAADTLPMPSLQARIYAAVQDIPRGRVSTYGRIARLAGAATPRLVGFAMAALPAGSRVPWHRVINSRGEISARRDGGPDPEQRRRLEAEGVYFDAAGRVDLRRYGWPED